MSRKKLKVVVIALVAVVVLLAALVIFLVLRGRPPATPDDSQPPGTSSTIQQHPDTTSSTAPGTEEHTTLIIGTWVNDYRNWTDAQREQFHTDTKIEFTADGKVIKTTWDWDDVDHPENWKVFEYEYRFDTYRGETVLYTEAFGQKSQPKYFEFYTGDNGKLRMDYYEADTPGVVAGFIKQD